MPAVHPGAGTAGDRNVRRSVDIAGVSTGGPGPVLLSSQSQVKHEQYPPEPGLQSARRSSHLPGRH